jgi:glycosyltransferase involved in cell wall biosynthesis
MRLLRYFVNQIKVLITPSNFVGEVVSRVYSNPRVTINNYVSVIKRRPYKVNGDILYIGRLAKEKGVQDLILAFSKVESRLPNRRLVLVGDGNYKQQLIDLTHSLKLERRIMFKGYKADVARYYRNSSLVVVPSQWPEPFGIVIIEAMAYGIPVIATGVGGISEIIKHGNNGYLCKPNDAHILARVILSFFRDTNRMKKMSAAAFNTSKQYSTQKFVAKLSKIYEMLK